MVVEIVDESIHADELHYTPGPWTYAVFSETRGNGKPIDVTYIQGHKGWSRGRRTIAQVGHWGDRPHVGGDVRVIAAAPEMLAILQLIAYSPYANLETVKAIADEFLVRENLADAIPAYNTGKECPTCQCSTE